MSTDTARKLPHWSLMRPNVGCGIWRGCPLRLSFFFFFVFFIPDSLQLGLIHTNFHQTWPICPESGHIGQIGSYRPATKMVETNRNRPKSVLNHAGIAKIGFEWGPNILNLSFLNFILNICCFFCVFFFVLCLLPSSFFVLWIKA